jgi:hypothetical protein
MLNVNVEGVKSGNEKKPSLVVRTVRTKPLSSAVSVTFTCGITAPAASWTVPESAPEVFWASISAGKHKSKSRRRMV